MTKVVLFKSESDGSDQFVEVLEKNNFIVRAIPSIDFYFKNLDILLEKLKNASDYEGLIFTSPRSIFATQQAVKEEEDDDVLKSWSDKTNFTIGDSSHDLAMSLLNVPSNGKESGNAQNLSPVIIDAYKKNNLTLPFLFPCGNQQQDILGQNLREYAIQLEYVEVYDTIAHPNLESAIEEMKTDDSISYIVYFSPSGVKCSLPLIKKHDVNLANIKLIAIGPSTQKCLQQNNLQCFKMCKKPSPESLLQCLI